MYLALKEFKSHDIYNLILTFENGGKRQFDINPYLETGIFKELFNLNTIV